MNKASRLEIKATIPTRQYENIQPTIEFKDIDIDEGSSIALDYINRLVSSYSEHGALPDISSTTPLQSFNEPDKTVEFDPIRHTYFYKGDRMSGATSVTSGFYKPFNADMVSKTCAKSWGVEAEDIKSMWSSNGDLSSKLGTVVHNALEHYDKFNALGSQIEANSKKSEVALPKHPLLRSIIEGFQKIATDEGTVVPEALITSVADKVCGQADRILILSEKEKVCRVQDYKINIDSEKEDKTLKPFKPFDTLPATKLTKYQIQMSIYANMLQKSGWRVEGLDAFVYEDEWKHYKLDVLNVI